MALLGHPTTQLGGGGLDFPLFIDFSIFCLSFIFVKDFYLE
jgi:hypothetical protein